MKKLVLIIILMSSLAYAQCTVDTQTPNTTGLYPNPLPTSSIGVPYNQSVTMVFPTQSDTTITIQGFGSQTFTAYYTSFQVQQVSGIPQGLTMPLSSCNASNCTYSINPNQTNRGCMTLSGTPTESGTFQITTTNYANGYTIMPFSILLIGLNAGDTLNFDDPRINSIPGLSGIITGFRTQTYSTPLQILTTSTAKPQQKLNAILYPNPGKAPSLQWFAIGLTHIQIKNTLGQSIFETTLNAHGIYNFNLPILPNGLYFVNLTSAEDFQSLKWICE